MISECTVKLNFAKYKCKYKSRFAFEDNYINVNTINKSLHFEAKDLDIHDYALANIN
jgi:hypothetical protein